MKALQKEYSGFREHILEGLWRQWTALGVAGQVSRPAASLIDPEALLLCSLSLCRYDARLFDEIMDWLSLNGEFINTQRLAALQEKYEFFSGPQLSAVAEHLSSKGEYRLKWKRLAGMYKNSKPEPLFFTMRGKPLPVGNDVDDLFLSKGLLRKRIALRHYSSSFPPYGIPSFILQLRALIGVSARCEILSVMSGVPEIRSAQMANYTGYNRKTVQNALREMSRSGAVQCRERGREKYYRMQALPFKLNDIESVRWISWAPLYKGIETLWMGIPEHYDDRLILSSHLRRTAQNARKYFEESQSGIYLSDPSRTPGEEYLRIYTWDILRISSEYQSLL